MAINLDEAIANDDVGKRFAKNYIPNVTKEQYEAAKKVMTWLLKKYGSRVELEQDENDWILYETNLYIVASYVEDEYHKAISQRNGLIDRRNQWSAFLEAHPHLVFDIPDFGMAAIKKYIENGKLRGLENLELIYERSNNPKEKFNALGNAIYNAIQMMGDRSPPVMLLDKPCCCGDWQWLGDLQYVS